VVDHKQRILTVLWLKVTIHTVDSLGWPTNPRNRSALRKDEGMATLETALMVPVLFLIAFVFLSGISLGVQALSLSDATRTAARELARGAGESSVREFFHRNEPNAHLQITWDLHTVLVESTKPGEFGVSFMGTTPLELSQSHTAPREWINAE
jgi:hypothetical protein